MSQINSDDKQGATGKRNKFKNIFIPLLTLLFIIAISIALFFYGHNPARMAELKSHGYLGAFLIGLIGNATVLLPGIVLPILSGLGILISPVTGLAGPVIVGLVGAAGAALGEMVGYMAGYSGHGIVKNKMLYKRLADWVGRWGAVAIFIFALVPLFFDVVGLAAGVLRFPLWKFVLACWLGRTILYVGFVVLAAIVGKAVLPPYLG